MSIADIFPFVNNDNLDDLFSDPYSFFTSDLLQYHDIQQHQSDHIVNLDSITYKAYPESPDFDENSFGFEEVPIVDIPITKYITSLPNRSNECLSILSLNIVSVPRNFDTFHDIHCQNGIPYDIFSLCETRLIDSLTPLFDIPDFTAFHQCRNRSGGGVSMYVRSSFNPTVDVNLSFTESYFESVAVTISINKSNMLVISLYRPPSANFEDFFYQKWKLY